MGSYNDYDEWQVDLNALKEDALQEYSDAIEENELQEDLDDLEEDDLPW